MITFVRFGLGKQDGGGGLGRPGGDGQMGERVRKLVSPPPPLSRLSYLESARTLGDRSSELQAYVFVNEFR